MLLLAADEDLNWRYLDAALARNPHIEIVRAQTAGLAGRRDADILEWAAASGRVLLTSDASTMPTAAYARVAGGLSMPGLIVIAQGLPIAAVVDVIELVAVGGSPGDFRDSVVFASALIRRAT